MREEPDVIRELRELEKLGFFQTKIQSDHEQKDIWESTNDSHPSMSICFSNGHIKNNVVKESCSSNSSIDVNEIITESLLVVFILKRNLDEFEYISANAKKLFGYTSNSFISGKTCFSDIIHPDDVNRVKTVFKNQFNNCIDNEFVIEYRIVTNNGTIKWVENKVVMKENNRTGEKQYLGSIWDITTHKRAKEDLIIAKQELEQKNLQLTQTMKRLKHVSRETEATLIDLDQIFNNAADGMIVVDANSRILRINKTFLDMFGISKAKSLGKKCHEVLDLKRCHTEKCPLKQIIIGVKRIEFEELLHIHDKTDMSCLITSVPYKNLEGRVVGTVQNFRDITKVKRIEKELRENSEQLSNMNKELIQAQEEREDYVNQLEERTDELQKINDKLIHSENKIKQQNIKLKKLDQLKSAFLNITSHELRTPMSSIKGYVQMILKEALGDITEEQKKSLEVVLRNTNRLDNLIQDILDISRLESGTMKFIPNRTKIYTMIQDVQETMRSWAEKKNISIEISVDKRVDYLTIDEDRIKQVLINLINNAIKFSSDHSVIKVTVENNRECVLFVVQDFGRGIPSDKLEKIFNTFYQVDSGVDRKFGGAGLGLAISRGIILAHGGEIWVESEGIKGKGSTFKFTLPIQPTKDLEERFKEVDVFRLEAIR